MRPLIGLTPLVEDVRMKHWMRPGYMEGVSAAGGLPVMLPLTADEGELAEAAARCDGLLLTGGPDVDPARYGQEILPVGVGISPERDAMECAAFRLFEAAGKPILGICRGVQLINVMRGGTLYQDIPAQHPSAIAHRQLEDHDVPTHEVRPLPSTPLWKLSGGQPLRVNTLHHQAVDRPGEGVEVMGVAPDGLIEAIWVPSYPFMWGVQWHPEYLWPKDDAAMGIFRAFVEACKA